MAAMGEDIMSRRIRTGVITLNSYGHYVCYIIDYNRKTARRSAILITDGPSKKAWWFDPLPVDISTIL